MERTKLSALLFLCLNCANKIHLNFTLHAERSLLSNLEASNCTLRNKTTEKLNTRLKIILPKIAEVKSKIKEDLQIITVGYNF